MAALLTLTVYNQYAIVLMMVLATATAERPFSLAQLVRRMDVSRPYIGSMLEALQAERLVIRDEWYGYRLGRAPGEITLKEICRVVGGSAYARRAERRKVVSAEFYELVLWKGFCGKMLEETTLAGVLNLVRSDMPMAGGV